jgi:hypothetical protein
MIACSIASCSSSATSSFKGDAAGWQWDGFLVANSEYVVTNDHVIRSCNPENKISVLRALKEVYIAAIKGGKLPSEIEEELRGHPSGWKTQTIPSCSSATSRTASRRSPDRWRANIRPASRRSSTSW